MITTKFSAINVFIGVIGGVVLADAVPLPATFVSWPGHACVWDPIRRSSGHVYVSAVQVANLSYTERLPLFCPLPFLQSYDDAGQLRGVDAGNVIRSPKVSLYDGSEDLTDGNVTASIKQFDANANGNWSSCSTVYSDAAFTGYTTLSPPYCSVYQIVTLTVELPKVTETFYTGSGIRFYTLENY